LMIFLSVKKNQSESGLRSPLGNRTLREKSPNNRINSDCQFRCAPLPAGYAERWASKKGQTMNDIDKSKSLVIKEDYATQLQSFESGFLSVVKSYGLPSKNIFVGVPERATVFKNVDGVLSNLAEEQKGGSVYLSKFLAATASGLFDAALNYLWDETIQEIRKRVIQYDVGYFFDNATHEEKRKRLHGPEDIVKLDDSELIQGARNIGLISELGFKHLDYIRYMRNWASAAHPNQNQLTGLQLISWLETCIKEVISLPYQILLLK